MKKFVNNKFLIICAICLIVCMVGGFGYTDALSGSSNNESASPDVSGANTYDSSAYTDISSAATDNVTAYDDIPLYVNGILTSECIKIGDTTYIPLRTFFDAIGEQTDIAWDEETNTATVTAENLEMTATVGIEYITANDRCFYVPGGVLNINGSVVIPIRELAKLYQVEVEWDEVTSSVSVCADDPQVLESADTYYDIQDLYWLSRLINAESGNQPLDGKIAVGDVVINRVADPTCPDTIYGVIFDSKYGVQFSVTEGGIYDEPNEESVIAAKICLEGYNLVGDSIYFVNPTVGVSSWFANTRLFVSTIGEHDFYA